MFVCLFVFLRLFFVCFLRLFFMCFVFFCCCDVAKDSYLGDTRAPAQQFLQPLTFSQLLLQPYIMANRQRANTVDILDAYGGFKELDEDTSKGKGKRRVRAVSEDHVNIKSKADENRKRSSSAEIFTDVIHTLFQNDVPVRSKSKDSRSTSVDVLNAFGGISEGEEEEES